MKQKPFTYALNSADRADGDEVHYRVDALREVVGDWRVTVRVSPFPSANDEIDEHTVLQLSIRCGGVLHDSSNPLSNWCSVLTMCPRIAAPCEGVFYVSGGLRGPIEVLWTSVRGGAAIDAAEFSEHVLNMEFVPI